MLRCRHCGQVILVRLEEHDGWSKIVFVTVDGGDACPARHN